MDNKAFIINLMPELISLPFAAYFIFHPQPFRGWYKKRDNNKIAYLCNNGRNGSF